MTRKQILRGALSICSVFALCFLTFTFVLAHEVYVLDEGTIAEALAADSLNPFSAYTGNEYEFYFWGLVSFIVLSTILFASTFHVFEKRLDAPLFFLKRYGYLLVRFTVGATLLAFGWYGVLYGPELRLLELFGALAGTVEIVLMALGVLILLGAYTRIASSIAVLLYLYSLAATDLYSFTYLNHLGAYAFLLIMGGGLWSLGTRWSSKWFRTTARILCERFRPFAFPILRITFGFAIMFAALYAKFVHSELAMQVVQQYELTRYFPFEPLFIVLGAFIIEFLAGLMMFLGVAVRWTAAFLAFWLTLAHLSMNEEWWVHLILYGLALAIFCHGYDRWSLMGRYLRKNGGEPVL